MAVIDALRYDENLEYFILGLLIGSDPALFGLDSSISNKRVISFENGWVLIE